MLDDAVAKMNQVKEADLVSEINILLKEPLDWKRVGKLRDEIFMDREYCATVGVDYVNMPYIDEQKVLLTSIYYIQTGGK